jgi:response regulator RpfG family c-di-GMP phosphodiesterase
MKILLAEDDEELRALLVFLLEGDLGIDVIEVGSGNEAIKLLSAQADIDVVVSDYNMPDGNGYEIFKFLQSKKNNVPFIICSSDPLYSLTDFDVSKIAGHIQKPVVAPLTKMIAEIRDKMSSGQMSKKMAEKVPEFCRIRIASLRKMSALVSDLYIKLSEDKYVKIANDGDTIDPDDFNRLSDKKIEYLYLRRENADLFLKNLTKEVLSYIHAKTCPRSETFKMSENLQQIVYDLGQELGFTTEVQALANSNVELAVSVIEQTSSLNTLLKDLLVEPDNYLCSHSVALAMVSTGLAIQMNMESGNNLFKLALAAFLHDMVLDRQTMTAIGFNEEYLSDALGSGEGQSIKFLDHPLEAAFIVAQFENVPPQVDTIIAQHHESPDGVGFPKGLNHSRIFPLAGIFIVAQDIVAYMWKKKKEGGEFDVEGFLKKQGRRYDLGYFRKIAMNIAIHAR